MAQKIINIGTTPNDGNGDPLRVAFEKINENFGELYNLAGNTAAPPDRSVQFRSTNLLSSVAYNSGVWVVFGSPARYYRSTDGVLWSDESAPVTEKIYSVVATASGFIAVGENGTIIVSNDGGKTWMTRTSGTVNDLYSVHYDQITDRYMAVGEAGSATVSSDGVNWETRATGVTQDLLSIANNPGGVGYVVVGREGVILLTLDGSSWTTQTAGIQEQLNSVTWDGNRYIAVGDGGTVITSTNAVDWLISVSGTADDLQSIDTALISNSTVTVAVGARGSSLFNTDGTGQTWTTVDTGTISELNSVTWTGNRFYSVGANGTILSTGNISGWSNTSVSGSFTGSANFTFDDVTNTLNTININSSTIQVQTALADIVAANQVIAYNLANLGPVENVKIFGGLSGQTLTTDGTGNLIWANGGGGGGNANVVSIPAIYFTATSNGNNQTFSNSYLNNYVNSNDLTVFLNGSLLEDGFYTLSGSTLTVTTPIETGDSIDIIRQFAANVISSNSTPGGNNTELQYNNNGVFAGISTVTWDGSNISLGAVNTVKITGGNIGEFLVTDGTGNLSWAVNRGSNYGNGNVAAYLNSGTLTANIIPAANNVYNLGSPTNQWRDLYLSGNTLYLSGVPVSIDNDALVVAGKQVITADTPIEGDIEITGNISANDATFIGNVEVTGNLQLTGNIQVTDGFFENLTSVNTDLGNVGNLKIFGGQTNQILSTDGSGNLQWIDRTSGAGPAGPLKSIQYNDGAGNFGGSSFLTYDSASPTLNIAGNLLANSISIGTGVYSFNRTFVHSAVTNSTIPDQEIYSIDADTTSGMDFMIISTDEASSSRQTTRFSVINYNANISYTETTTMTINNYLGNWNILYQPGSVIRDPQIVLTFTPETSNVMYHRMMITTYEP